MCQDIVERQHQSCSVWAGRMLRNRRLKGTLPAIPSCHFCVSGRPSECSFQETRVLRRTSSDDLKSSFCFHSAENPEPMKFRQVFQEYLLPKQADRAFPSLGRQLTRILAPIKKLPGTIPRHILSHNRKTRTTCDVCRMVYTVLILKCTKCGFECCPLCREEHRDTLPEHVHEYAALLCFEQEQIAELEAFAQHWSEQPLWEPKCAIPKTELRTQPPVMHVISADALNTDTLIYFLSRGIPLVITGVSTQIKWDPVAMTFHFGDLGCVIEDAARLNTPRRGTVADFYAPWISQQMRPEEGLLMKKDFPPKERLGDACKELAKDYQAALPFKIQTHPEGAINMTAHFPTNISSPPDLIKMYSARGVRNGRITTTSGILNLSDASTRAHLDLCHAVNVMVHSQPGYDGQRGALWHVFKREQKKLIRQFLKDHGIYDGELDPIHSHANYFDADLLALLKKETGVEPFSHEQQVGEAVLIPAGAVVNVGHCIKVAEDFLSTDNASLDEFAELAEEFRQRNLSHSAHDDVLELDRHILFTVLSMRSHPMIRDSLKRKADNESKIEPLKKKAPCDHADCQKKKGGIPKLFTSEGLKVHKIQKHQMPADHL